MTRIVTTTAVATDPRHLELQRPLDRTPDEEVRVWIFMQTPSSQENTQRADDFLQWANRERPHVGLPDAGRDTIYDD
ncbi:hypothetical protein [Luteolibacter sp. LG18]|uniref:hypothetical protein n=1 Tax=Luteolibacter sp. LG18 TaxID=2819286 RepID=UPI002B29EF88|nr:hypothetical protein llg_11710 [Luteolibacter sp. LG18]